MVRMISKKGISWRTIIVGFLVSLFIMFLIFALWTDTGVRGMDDMRFQRQRASACTTYETRGCCVDSNVQECKHENVWPEWEKLEEEYGEEYEERVNEEVNEEFLQDACC